jgi:uncharacterized RDD family membrane protein YckC
MSKQPPSDNSKVFGDRFRTFATFGRSATPGSSVEASSSGAQGSPLERYLARKKAQAGGEPHQTPVSSSEPTQAVSSSELRQAVSRSDLSSPAGQSVSAVPNLSETGSGSSSAARGDFGSRLVAYLIDLVIVGALESFVSPILVESVFSGGSGASDELKNAAERVVLLAIIFVYYGWFYHEKGATPGKILIGLGVEDSRTGERLSYARSFFRETIGKLISTVPLMVGFLIAFFREDRKALHDLIFDTTVVRHKTEQ